MICLKCVLRRKNNRKPCTQHLVWFVFCFDENFRKCYSFRHLKALRIKRVKECVACSILFKFKFPVAVLLVLCNSNETFPAVKVWLAFPPPRDRELFINMVNVNSAWQWMNDTHDQIWLVFFIETESLFSCRLLDEQENMLHVNVHVNPILFVNVRNLSGKTSLRQ